MEGGRGDWSTVMLYSRIGQVKNHHLPKELAGLLAALRLEGSIPGVADPAVLQYVQNATAFHRTKGLQEILYHPLLVFLDEPLVVFLVEYDSLVHQSLKLVIPTGFSSP